MNTSPQILVADDNMVNQTVVKRLLERAGYEVSTVQNGVEAIEALENNRFHLVIMDCMMPIMDGFTATAIIRDSDPARFDPQIPIIATTALATDKDREKCMDAGMTAFVTKPIVAGSFLEKVACSLGSASDAGAGPEIPEASPAVSSEEESQQAFQASILNSMSGRIVAEAKQWQRDLHALAGAGRLDDLGKLAHKIRGTADVIGRASLSAVSEDLEACASRNEPDVARDLTTQLVDELQQLIGDLCD
jgi:protein-histidine pros-kinase